ncbi:MAG: hypothetical protein COA66_09190 [Arcobacter sp.]|nr:MAG: hypothetical protein COA66_09190 [Arcobacter sp.]
MRIISTGKIKNLHTNNLDDFSISIGLDYQLTYTFENEWKDVTNKIVGQILKDSNGDNDKISKGLNDNLIQDAGWNWFRKTQHCNSSAYEWFYLTIDNKVEACCILYHPKNSVIDTKSISYIDYLAVAPWNRDTIIGKRKYSSLGLRLLSKCCDYIKSNHLYRYGFSLHSLPQTLPLYVKIGMIDYGKDKTKENLNYLEMTEDNTETMVKRYA